MKPFVGMPVVHLDYVGAEQIAFVENVNEDGSLELLVWEGFGWKQEAGVKEYDEAGFNTTDVWRLSGPARTTLDAMRESVADARLRELCHALKPLMKKPELVQAAFGTGRHLVLSAAYTRAREHMRCGRKS